MSIILAAVLAACPRTSSNCVSSVEIEPARKVEPFTFADSPENAWSRLVTALEKYPRLEIVELRPGYIHAVAASKLFHFKDDVEFTLDSDHHIIDVRSASRLGSYDFGVNRRRVKNLRRLFMGWPSS
jgi:uncharacterized protein (DUF1499 family)